MIAELSYEQRTLSSKNPITRFAHQSRYALSLALCDTLVPKNGRIVDFGAGQGSFLAKFHDIRPDASLIAIEPHMDIVFPFIERVALLDDLATGSVDVVGAFETLEHLTDEELTGFFVQVTRVLRPAGRLLVTVPVMYGAMLPVKEASAALLRRSWGDTGPIELLKATLGTPIQRTGNRQTSHKGFDFRQLDALLRSSFTVLRQTYSPFRQLPWWLNSQAVFVCSNSG